MELTPSMIIANYSLIFLFGLIIGSFLNVVVLRMGSGRTLSGRSKCLSCGKKLKWYMLIPIFSYLWQGGRCAYCKTRLTPQYPIVEALTGVLVLVAAKHTGFTFFGAPNIVIARFVVDAVALATLVVIAAYDLRHKIIPDSLSLTFAIAGLAAVALRAYAGLWPSLMPLITPLMTPKWLDLAAAPLLALPLAAIWWLSKGRAMGLGDAKLLWGAAWFLGFIGGLSAIIYAFWLAALPSLAILVMRKGTMKTEVPFGPFIALAVVLVYYFGWNVLTLGLSFY